MGYVYAVVSMELRRVKIGWCESEKQFNRRFDSFQCGSPVGLGLHSIAKHTNAHRIEQQLHRRFKSARIMGEWFDMDDYEVNKWLTWRERFEDPF